jgi:hypothetical protein
LMCDRIWTPWWITSYAHELLKAGFVSLTSLNA